MSPPSPPPSIDAPSLPLDHPLSQLSISVSSPPLSESASASAVAEIPIPTDPPPPYPSPTNRNRVRRSRGARNAGTGTGTGSRRVSRTQQQPQQHTPQTSSSNDSDNDAQRSPRTPLSHPLAVDDNGNYRDDSSETSPLLGGGVGGRTRPRSISQSSMTSFAPSLASLAQTAWVFFSECESDIEDGRDHDRDGVTDDDDDAEDPHSNSNLNFNSHPHPHNSIRRLPPPPATSALGLFFSAQLRLWKQYFRPLSKPVYWRSLTHLVLVNFPFALVAWVYLFVFTLTGTTLLIALPLGAILCFFNLLGARAFARAELFLQTRFHSPLHYPLSVLHATAALSSSSTTSVPSTITNDLVRQTLIAQYPVFTRTRNPSASELESGQAVVGDRVEERSFYRNSYAMFTSPTSYQALFYFLIVKAAITLLFTLFFLIVCIPLLVLVIPAPVVLRVCRRIGKWQAVVAVEGLAVGVR